VRRIARTSCFVFVAVLIIGGLVWAYLASRAERSKEVEQEEAIRTPPRIGRNDRGEVVITVTPEAENAAGLKVQKPVQVKPGLQIPQSALLYDGGKTWVYQKIGANTYLRTETKILRTGSLYVVSLASADPVVTVGAQVLLSEELKSRIQGGD
jgi:hypothetical protein